MAIRAPQSPKTPLQDPERLHVGQGTRTSETRGRAIVIEVQSYTEALLKIKNHLKPEQLALVGGIPFNHKKVKWFDEAFQKTIPNKYGDEFLYVLIKPNTELGGEDPGKFWYKQLGGKQYPGMMFMSKDDAGIRAVKEVPWEHISKERPKDALPNNYRAQYFGATTNRKGATKPKKPKKHKLSEDEINKLNQSGLYNGIPKRPLDFADKGSYYKVKKLPDGRIKYTLVRAVDHNGKLNTNDGALGTIVTCTTDQYRRIDPKSCRWKINTTSKATSRFWQNKKTALQAKNPIKRDVKARARFVKNVAQPAVERHFGKTTKPAAPTRTKPPKPAKPSKFNLTGKQAGKIQLGLEKAAKLPESAKKALGTTGKSIGHHAALNRLLSTLLKAKDDLNYPVKLEQAAQKIFGSAYQIQLDKVRYLKEGNQITIVWPLGKPGKSATFYAVTSFRWDQANKKFTDQKESWHLTKAPSRKKTNKAYTAAKKSNHNGIRYFKIAQGYLDKIDRVKKARQIETLGNVASIFFKQVASKLINGYKPNQPSASNDQTARRLGSKINDELNVIKNGSPENPMFRIITVKVDISKNKVKIDIRSIQWAKDKDSKNFNRAAKNEAVEKLENFLKATNSIARIRQNIARSILVRISVRR